MARIAVDFGTSNTIIARQNTVTGQPETLEIPGFTIETSYRPHPNAPLQTVHILPSLIHYGEKNEVLLGNQVLSSGLGDHKYTLRWMKRSIAQRSAPARSYTPQGSKTLADAGADFLRTALNYISHRVSFANDEFTFTVPVEAFEDYQEWLLGVADSLGIRRIRILDEPTAAALGYQDALHSEDRFLIFDFGGGTLDVLVARIDLADTEGRKVLQLGKSGRELGGMNIDRWIADDFLARHGITGTDRRELLSTVMRRAEALKIDLSDPDNESAYLSVEYDNGNSVRLKRTLYTADCRSCLRGRTDNQGCPEEACLGCLLLQKGFSREIRNTIDQALELATAKVGFQRHHLTKVIVTGGTSLMLGVSPLLSELFGDVVVMDRPFDAVARGATREDEGTGMVLVHDYAVEGYDRLNDNYVFEPLFKAGDDYPTTSPVRYSLRCSNHGARKVEFKIYEVSRLKRKPTEEGGIQERHSHSNVKTDKQCVWLNAQNPTFVVIDPPYDEQRDIERIKAEFTVDANRRLLVTVADSLAKRPLLKDYPVVRL